MIPDKLFFFRADRPADEILGLRALFMRNPVVAVTANVPFHLFISIINARTVFFYR